jgi:hypothetical protein
MSEGKIDWNKMCDGPYVKLVAGKQKKLVVQDWKPQDKFKDDETGELRPGVTFNVLEEDSETVNKEYTVTAVKALSQWREICEKADADGRTQVRVSVTKTGEGKNTVYSIYELEGE